MTRTVVTSNAHLEELAPSTASWFSSLDGWHELDDQSIDSSITGGLEMVPYVSFKRERVGALYRYTLSLLSPAGMRQGIELGAIRYRRITSERVSLGLKAEPDILRNKVLCGVLNDAATGAKIKVDSEHNVGIFYNFQVEGAPWDKMDEDARTKKMVGYCLWGYTSTEVARMLDYASGAVVRNRMSHLRRKYGKQTIPHQKDKSKYAKYFRGDPLKIGKDSSAPIKAAELERIRSK